MHTVKLFFLGAILGMIPAITLAQSSTNSPYTRYGYGNLADQAFTSQRGMGGIGYGLRNPQMINSMNPASFSSVDSMTFMFDMGVSGQMSWLKDSFGQEQKNNGNLEYLALQFPVAKRFGIGAGFEPVSSVGYSYMDTVRLPVDNGLSQNTYTGYGGQSRIYAIFSYDLLSRLSVGVKLSYLFGDIVHGVQNSLVTVSSTNGYSTTRSDTIRSYGFLYDFGLQYHQSVGKFKSVTIGAVYSPKIRFGAKVMSGNMQIDPSTSLVTSNETWVSRDSVFELPESYGLGFTYNQLGKLTVGADVLYQRWADAKFYDQTNAFNNRFKVNAGGEYIPNRTGSSLLSKMYYRAGLYYTDSYLKVKDSKYNEYGATLGVGIPIQDRRSPERRSFVNLALEYSLVQPELKNVLTEERYFKISLSYTFNELWFFKQKVQ